MSFWDFDNALSSKHEMMTTRNHGYSQYNYVKVLMSLPCRKNEHRPPTKRRTPIWK